MRPTPTLLILLLLAPGCSGERTAASPLATLATPAATAPTRVAPPAEPSAAAAKPDLPDVVREYIEMFYRGELDLLHAKFTEEMRKEVSLDQLSVIHENAITSFGKQTEIVREDSQRNEDYRAFVRWARFDKTEQIIEIQWILRAESDEIAGFFIRPAQRTIRTEADAP